MPSGSSPTRRPLELDVAVVGAGIIGCAAAHCLAGAARLRIGVFDRGEPGSEASGAAAGVLAVASGRAPRGVLLELRRVAAGMFPHLVSSLEEETGVTVGYRRSGLLGVALDEHEAAELRTLAELRRRQGFACEIVTGAALRTAQPGLPAGADLGVLFPDEAALDAAALVRALVAASRRRGVQFFSGTNVRALQTDETGVTLHLNQGCATAKQVVVAAGAWSGEVLAANGVRVPLRPARGEMLAVAGDGTLRRTLKSGDTYVLARGDEIWIGSTNEFAGFDKSLSPEGARFLQTNAAQLFPGVAGAAVRRRWVGLRPCPTIRRPIMARLPGHENVILATGHHRSGILLAPITAKLVTEILLEQPPSVPLEPFAYRRR